jgi:hypothetical protein
MLSNDIFLRYAFINWGRTTSLFQPLRLKIMSGEGINGRGSKHTKALTKLLLSHEIIASLRKTKKCRRMPAKNNHTNPDPRKT